MLKELARRTLPAEALSFLRSAKLYYSTHTYTSKLVHHSYAGNSFLVHIRDASAELIYDHDWPEPKKLTLLKQHGLKAGANVFNIGAHHGIVALMLSSIVCETGQVIAVEAGPYSAKVCELNRTANSVTNMRVINEAVAAEPGTLRFAESLCGHVDDGHGGIEVTARTIDDLADEHGHPNVLYMDIEGFECEALRGADKTLARGSDFFIEVHGGVGLEKYGGSVSELLSFFPADRYQLFAAEEDGDDFAPLPDLDDAAERLSGQRWFLVATLKK